MEAAIRKGRELPQWYLDEPPVQLLDDFYLRCFWDLDTERYFSNGPIPVTRIREYGYQFDLDADIINQFVDLIRTMDAAHDKWVSDEQDRQRKSKS